jgi:putative membrane protein
MLFLWLKAFHIIAVVCWFAALFYLPRLFVYHAMAEDQASTDRFKVMERKLYRGIANPSMIASLLLGSAILWVVPGYLSMAWMHLKLVLVGLLIIYHFLCRKHLRELAEDRSDRSHIYFRWFNEVPVFMLVGIVILVVVRPF